MMQVERCSLKEFKTVKWNSEKFMASLNKLKHFADLTHLSLTICISFMDAQASLAKTHTHTLANVQSIKQLEYFFLIPKKKYNKVNEVYE